MHEGLDMPKPRPTKPKSIPHDSEAPGELHTPAILFDPDGTLLDSAYEPASARQEALNEEGVQVLNARIHRCVGMSGKRMLNTLFAELGRKVSADRKTSSRFAGAQS
jgi:beta-phosphoglucomutase-like phosphatase (HAD superfamily)